MAVDLDTMSDEAIAQLAASLQQELTWRAAAREAEDQANRTAIKDAITQLKALIGPESPTTPGLNSISEIRLYTQQQMQDNAGLALERAFLGLDLLARTVLSMAIVQE